jgi:hypothetical protein
MNLYEPQPARLIYAYDKGWKVIGSVFADIIPKTTEKAAFWFGMSAESASEADDANKHLILKIWLWAAAAGLFIAAISHYFAAALIFLFFASAQIFLMVLWVLITSLLMAILSISAFLYSNIYKIFYRCPHTGCYEQISLPEFICKDCSTMHSRLWPSVYGVFSHQCNNCDTNLPTLDIFGRKDLERRCPHCKRPLNKDIGQLKNIHIAVVGGPSTGKSNYIFMAVRQFISQYASRNKVAVNFPDDKDQQEYEANVKRFSQGNILLKTEGDTPHAYTMSVKKRWSLHGRIVYIYDAAGEVYSNEKNTALQTYYDYIHGLILVVDPFAIEAYANQNKKEIEKIRKSVGPSRQNPMSAYERMLSILEISQQLNYGKKYTPPVVVLVTKIDALDLDDQIGKLDDEDFLIVSKKVEEFLEQHGLGNMVRDLRLNFSNILFYSCSALGRLPDGENKSAFEPKGALEPFIWLLKQLQVVNKENIISSKSSKVPPPKVVA